LNSKSDYVVCFLFVVEKVFTTSKIVSFLFCKKTQQPCVFSFVVRSVLLTSIMTFVWCGCRDEKSMGARRSGVCRSDHIVVDYFECGVWCGVAVAFSRRTRVDMLGGVCKVFRRGIARVPRELVSLCMVVLLLILMILMMMMMLLLLLACV